MSQQPQVRTTVNEDALSPEDRAVILQLQNGLPIVEEPYAEIGERVGMTEDEVIDRIEDLMERKVIRRLGAKVAHLNVGYNFNAMGVWKVAEDVERVGKIMAGFDFVTHCYERPIYPGKWEYNVFSMVHGKSKEECEEKIETIAEATGVDEYDMIYSITEFKKTGVKLPEE